jgi:hypothetical protein
MSKAKKSTATDGQLLENKLAEPVKSSDIKKAIKITETAKKSAVVVLGEMIEFSFAPIEAELIHRLARAEEAEKYAELSPEEYVALKAKEQQDAIKANLKAAEDELNRIMAWRNPQPDAAETVEAEPEAVKTVEAEPEAIKTVEAEPEAIKTVEAEPETAKTVETEPEAAKTVEAEPEAAKTVETEPETAETDAE